LHGRKVYRGQVSWASRSVGGEAASESRPGPRHGSGQHPYAPRVPAQLDQQLGIPVYTRPGSAGVDPLTRAEWLLTNGLGGFAMGTASGIPTRRYHALLVAAVRPPVQREVLLSHLAETLIADPGAAAETRFELASFRFRGGQTGHRGHEHLLRFEKGVQAEWNFRVGDIELTKLVHLFRDRNAVAVRYTLHRPRLGCTLMLRPLVAMRESHGITGARWAWHEFHVESSERRARVSRGGLELHLSADSGWFEHDQQWWYGFEYEQERLRGYDHHEDLFSPGVFTVRARQGQEVQVTVTAWHGEPPGQIEDDLRENRKRLVCLMDRALGPSAGAQATAPGSPIRQAIRKLVLAADDFVVRRGTGAGVSIIAGYPWFTDWGRDSMISLPGLLLATRRHAEARSLLETFASHRRGGLIPNVFDDRTGEAWYNTVDASLWFLHAACEYLRVTADRAGFDARIRGACLDIVDAYRRGTDFGIRMDPEDGLIEAGSPDTQLTWMDAKREGVVFTPRHGKPVEINALWYSGLLQLADAVRADDAAGSRELTALARRVGASIASKFWNPSLDCCHDVLTPAPGGGWAAVPQVRPNQVFAVSLPHSPLSQAQKEGVLAGVRKHLLTPHGLRTLSPEDPGYRGRFRGPMFERDGAYHNGTVWPWLLGPYAEAVLRAGNFSAGARQEAVAALEPIINALEEGALGHIPEVYDGDDTFEEPQSSGGCVAQAWSVAEVLRVLMMLV
jgi:predicted glycogen debranching enzyme